LAWLVWFDRHTIVPEAVPSRANSPAKHRHSASRRRKRQR
jgi:hypothetical protein